MTISVSGWRLAAGIATLMTLAGGVLWKVDNRAEERAVRTESKTDGVSKDLAGISERLARVEATQESLPAILEAAVRRALDSEASKH